MYGTQSCENLAISLSTGYGREKDRNGEKNAHIENKMVVHGNLFFTPSQIITTPFARIKKNTEAGSNGKRIKKFTISKLYTWNAVQWKENNNTGTLAHIVCCVPSVQWTCMWFENPPKIKWINFRLEATNDNQNNRNRNNNNNNE